VKVRVLREREKERETLIWKVVMSIECSGFFFFFWFLFCLCVMKFSSRYLGARVTVRFMLFFFIFTLTSSLRVGNDFE
jgi:hypothetical protein